MLCFRITTDPPPPFPDRQQAGFEAVVWRCLEKDPDRRFASVHALAVALSPFAPPHATPLVERIGRVLQGRADGPVAPPAAAGDALETLREMSGQRMRRTAAAPRTRKLIGVIATIGALAAAGTAAVVLGVGRDGGAVTEPATQPAAEHRATPPVAASAPAPVVAPPPEVAASAPAPVVASPPPPDPGPEPAIAPAAAPEATSPARGEPPHPLSPAPSPATRPRGKERHRRPTSATPTRPVPAAPPAATPAPTDTPPPAKPPAAPDPLASPD
jgi:serine/threonine-protein kinase